MSWETPAALAFDLIDQARAFLAAVDRRDEVRVWNRFAAELTGRPPEAVLGRSVFGFVPAGERGRLEGILQQCLAGEPARGFTARFLHADGSVVTLGLNFAPVQAASGSIEAVVAIGEDLTLVQSLRAAAEHAERLAGIGRLVAGVVHELNNPLTAVTMYSEALVEKLERAGHDPADLEKLRAIRDGGLRIQRLARDLVTYARPSSMTTERLQLDAVLDEALRLAKPALKEANAKAARRFERVPPVEGNRASLVQVFVNLVANAAQAVTARGAGTVAVAVAPAPDGVAVTVEDTGEGMTDAVQARAFEPFFTTRPGRGIGLGLPIVQGIVERHGGTMSLESRAGEGTKVTVVLPTAR